MKVDGNVTMNGQQAAVYEKLSNPEVLRQCLPGCEKFDEVAPGRYDAVMKAGVAGIRGTFTGTVTLSNANPPDSYTLTVDGTFSGGFVKGVGNMTLTPDGDSKTKVTYTGDGQVGGPLASIGQRLMMPAARMLINQFFKCMDGK
ncbi:MAG: carbon monoxide dehydrogenase subunit G [Thermomicrobiales bacterium]